MLRYFVGVYIGYLALVILVVTPVANYFLVPVYQQQTGRILKTNGVGINPFNLTLFLYRSEDRNPSGDVLWSVDELSINISLASLLGKGLVLDSFKVQGLYVHPQKNQGGLWAFDDILRYRESLLSSPAPEQSTEQGTGLPAITIEQIDLHARHLGYTDLDRPEVFTASLEEIRISLRDFSTTVEEGKPYHFLARDETGGELEWQGTLSLPGSYSEGELYLRKISLMPAWRFIQSDVNFRMDSAFLDMGGKYQLSWKDVANPDYRIKEGNLHLSEIDLSPKTDKASGLQIKNVSLEGIAVDGSAKHFEAQSLTLDDFRGTVSILEDGTTNFQSMFAPAKQTPAAQVARSPDDTPNPWSIQLDTLKINNAAFAFNDYAIEPDFRVQIQSFSGDIKPLSSDSSLTTQVNLAGNVDGYAPVTLKGTVKPFASSLDLDLYFDFRGIELSSFAPYSGTYAGYRINSGVMSVSLGYALENDRIKGSNRVIINQLTLGERVQSARLIDLPLRLALALLTDENGVIDLEVDVSGNTQSPDFSIGKIIWKAFRNVIVKAVTAPFRLLSGLAGGETSEFVRFGAGSAILQETEKLSLAKLKEALAKRQTLNLGVTGLYDEEDRRWIKATQFHETMQGAGIKADDIEDRSWSFRRQINKRYEARWPDDEQDVPVEEKYQRLINSEPNPELKLDQLREARALAVKLYLLQELKMDPGRVYVDVSLHPEKQPAAKLLLEPR
jgi:hypothetical protein